MKHISALVIALTFCLVTQAKELNGKMPDFTLENIQGGNIRLEELRGKVVMLNFWATWCGPCRQEMPVLEDLYQRYNKAGFIVLGVNIENSRDEKKRQEIEGFTGEKKLTFPILLDNQKQVVTVVETDFLKKNMGMPTTLFIDRSGNVRFIHEAYKTGDEGKYKQMIKTLLKE